MGSRIGLHGSMFGVVLEKDASGAKILARTIAPVRLRKQSWNWLMLTTWRIA